MSEAEHKDLEKPIPEFEFFGNHLEIQRKVCYNISHVGAGNPVGIYVLVAHEYQEMLRANSANLPAFFVSCRFDGNLFN